MEILTFYKGIMFEYAVFFKATKENLDIIVNYRKTGF